METAQSNGQKAFTRPRTNSYLKVLSNISHDLNLVASDLKNSHAPFQASSPKSPLAVSASCDVPAGYNGSPTLDRYEHLRITGSRYVPSTNNNASTVCTPYAHSSVVPGPGTDQLPVLFPQSLDGSSSPSVPHYRLPPTLPQYDVLTNTNHPRHFSADSMELSLWTRLVHTKPIWFLPRTQRAAAIHYLQARPVGTFLVCQARDKDSMVLAMKHPGNGSGLYIEKLPIVATKIGVMLVNTKQEFSTIEELILHYLYDEGTLPCKLVLPAEIMASGNVRALQSLALFEEEFWNRPANRGTSEPMPESTPRSDTKSGDTLLSPRGWFTFPVVANSQQEQQALHTKSVLPPEPSAYMHMSKLPPSSLTPANATLNQARPHLRNRKVNSISTDTKRLHKSWSFDEHSNPFLDYVTSQIKNEKRVSIDDTLLAGLDRQPMRCSTQSRQDFLLNSRGHHPPPQHSPPPPPNETLPFSLDLQYSDQQHSTDCRKLPLPATRQCPSSTFGSASPPPVPPRRAINQPDQWQPHQGHTTSPYSSHNRFPVPSPRRDPNYSRVDSPLASSKSSAVSEAESPYQRPNPIPSHVMQPNVMQPNVVQPLVVTADQLDEFDPLLSPRRPSSLSCGTATIALVATKQSRSLPSEEVTTGQLLDLDINTDEEESVKTADGNEPEPMTGECDPDATSGDSERSGEDGDEEEEESREGLSTSETDSQSGHSFEFIIGSDDPDPPKEQLSGEPLRSEPLSSKEPDVHHVSEVTPKKKKKKKKKKSPSNLTKIQKYVLRSTKKKKKQQRDPTEEIHSAIFGLASNKNSYFSRMVDCFVQNIKEKGEIGKPDKLIRNIRQFMSGMKNYLFNRREPELDATMDKYSNLVMNELDVIVETSLHFYILLPLKSEIYKCIISEHKASGSLDVLDNNMQLARAKTPVELGVKAKYCPPEGNNLLEIRRYFHQLEHAYSPIKKLEHLLDIVRMIYDTVVDKNSSRGEAVQSMGADDFLPMFIYVLVQCEVVNIEIEADYMWGTLETSMLSGEGGYYLTTLSSAICVLKQFEQENFHTQTKGFLSVMVALGEEEDVHLVHKTLPVLPGMNAEDVCRILAHKLKISNPHLYKIFLLSGTEEMLLAVKDCPLEMKEELELHHKRACFFGYKQADTQVNWFTTS